MFRSIATTAARNARLFSTAPTLRKSALDSAKEVCNRPTYPTLSSLTNHLFQTDRQVRRPNPLSQSRLWHREGRGAGSEGQRGRRHERRRGREQSQGSRWSGAGKGTGAEGQGAGYCR